MVRNVSALLGLVLLAMFVIAIAGPYRVEWLLWLDLAAAIGAFVIAAVAPKSTREVRVGAPIAMAVALFALWIIALSTHVAQNWLAWLNFAVGGAFLLLGIGESATRKHVTPVHSEDVFRRSA